MGGLSRLLVLGTRPRLLTNVLDYALTGDAQEHGRGFASMNVFGSALPGDALKNVLDSSLLGDASVNKRVGLFAAR